MTNVSRRSVAKGAAWSIPAVAVGSAAPAFAVSQVPVECGVTPAVTDTGLKSLSGVVGTQSTYDPANAGLAKKGTYISLSAGMWQFSKPTQTDGKTADYVTGYSLSVPAGSVVRIQTFNGTKSTAAWDGSGVLTTPQVIGAGLAMAFNIQTNVPYTAGISNSANWIQGISLPICVDWRAGLTSVLKNPCCYWMNYTFNQPALGSAGVANGGNAYSLTVNPQY